MLLDIISASLIFGFGMLFGWTLGTIRTNAPLIRYFRDYYRRQAEARMRQHTNFLLAQAQQFGAALKSHRSAATEAFKGGGKASVLISPFDAISKGKAERKEGTPISHRLENS